MNNRDNKAVLIPIIMIGVMTKEFIVQHKLRKNPLNGVIDSESWSEKFYLLMGPASNTLIGSYKLNTTSTTAPDPKPTLLTNLTLAF